MEDCELTAIDLSNNNLRDSGVKLISAGLKHPHITLKTIRSDNVFCNWCEKVISRYLKRKLPRLWIWCLMFYRCIFMFFIIKIYKLWWWDNLMRLTNSYIHLLERVKHFILSTLFIQSRPVKTLHVQELSFIFWCFVVFPDWVAVTYHREAVKLYPPFSVPSSVV